MDKIAIVILNWNGADMLRKYLPSVLANSGDGVSVYVADNKSSDDSLTLLRNEFSECRIIELEKNWGFAEGYNKALAGIDAEYYLLLNSDIEVTENWLRPLVTFMDSHPDVAACQPKLLSICDRGAFEYAGASGGFIDKYGYPFCRGRIFDTVERDEGQYDGNIEIFWATGAALMVRADDYNTVGGLDGRFFAHNEEIDLCWRLRMLGKGIYCIPESKVYHVGGGTLPKSNPMKTYLNFRNNLTMLYKCLPEAEIRRVMRIRMLLDYLAAFEMLLLKRSPKDFMAVLRARREFGRWKKDFKAEREHIMEACMVKKIPGRFDFSILWQYYVKGYKRFSDLPMSDG